MPLNDLEATPHAAGSAAALSEVLELCERLRSESEEELVITLRSLCELFGRVDVDLALAGAAAAVSVERLSALVGHPLASIHVHAILALANLSSDELAGEGAALVVKDRVRHAGGLDQAIRHLSSDQPEVLFYAIGMCQNCCSTVEDATKLFNSGMLPRLVTLSRCGDEAIESLSLGCLQNMRAVLANASMEHVYQRQLHAAAVITVQAHGRGCIARHRARRRRATPALHVQSASLAAVAGEGIDDASMPRSLRLEAARMSQRASGLEGRWEGPTGPAMLKVKAEAEANASALARTAEAAGGEPSPPSTARRAAPAGCASAVAEGDRRSLALSSDATPPARTPQHPPIGPLALEALAARVNATARDAASAAVASAAVRAEAALPLAAASGAAAVGAFSSSGARTPRPAAAADSMSSMSSLPLASIAVFVEGLESPVASTRGTALTMLCRMVTGSTGAVEGGDGNAIGTAIREAGGCDAISRLLVEPDLEARGRALFLLSHLASDALDSRSYLSKKLLWQCGTADRLLPCLAPVHATAVELRGGGSRHGTASSAMGEEACDATAGGATGGATSAATSEATSEAVLTCACAAVLNLSGDANWAGTLMLRGAVPILYACGYACMPPLPPPRTPTPPPSIPHPPWRANGVFRGAAIISRPSTLAPRPLPSAPLPPPSAPHDTGATPRAAACIGYVTARAFAV